MPVIGSTPAQGSLKEKQRHEEDGRPSRVEGERQVRRSLVPHAGLDLLIAAALCAFAVGVRLNFPHDGLFYDDAWQAFGAAKASGSQLYTVGQSQPVFTAALFAWSRIFGSGASTMVIPALIAGALGPPALYLVFRFFGYARSIAFLMGAVLSVATTAILYSTRVKTYTTDILVVLFLAVIVDRLATRRWDRRVAAIWIGIALVTSATTAIGPLVAGAAGVIFVVYPHGDRQLRFFAVGTQFALELVYVIAVLRTYNERLVNGFWDTAQGFVRFTANPFRLVHEILQHLVRVTSTFPGGPSHWADATLLIAALGLAAAAWRSRVAMVARFLALAIVLAICGSIAHRIPFGPLLQSTNNARITLWTIPAVALGLAESMERTRRRVAQHRAGRFAMDAGVLLIAGCVLLSGARASNHYPRDGGDSATRYVMAHLGSRDAVWITREMTYSFALSAGTRVRVRATPNAEVGFIPAFEDRRLNVLNFSPTQRQLSRSVENASRVWVFDPLHARSIRTANAKYYASLKQSLKRFGFVMVSGQVIGQAYVERWARKSS